MERSRKNYSKRDAEDPRFEEILELKNEAMKNLRDENHANFEKLLSPLREYLMKVEKIIQLIESSEAKRLDFEGLEYFPLDIKNIIFFPVHDNDNIEELGSYDPQRGEIRISESLTKEKRLQLLSTIIHENIHRHQFLILSKEIRNWNPVRVGFMETRRYKTRFKALLEGVTQYYTLFILKNTKN